MNWQTIHRAILAWYAESARDLPWRRTRDPYAILVAELMLQQTQVDRVVSRYNVFLAQFPSFAALSIAPSAEVIRAWQGLGYNRRAVRLQRIAQVVCTQHAGMLPDTIDGLTALEGVEPLYGSGRGLLCLWAASARAGYKRAACARPDCARSRWSTRRRAGSALGACCPGPARRPCLCLEPSTHGSRRISVLRTQSQMPPVPCERMVQRSWTNLAHAARAQGPVRGLRRRAVCRLVALLSRPHRRAPAPAGRPRVSHRSSWVRPSSQVIRTRMPRGLTTCCETWNAKDSWRVVPMARSHCHEP